MRRRTFLGSLLTPVAALAQGKALSITDVEIWLLEGSEPGVAGLHRQYQTRPLHVYDDQRPEPYVEPAEGRPATESRSARYLVIKTREGVEGLYGPVDAEAAVVVDRQLKPFLIGKNALAVETVWDQLHRLNRHSRSSHYMMAISAVDNALWDLRGRYFEAPVYQLLGGPTRRQATAYGSTLGYSAEPGKAGPRAAELVAKGFRHQKWFIPYGPGHGAEGLRKNIALVEELRAAVGPDVDLMFDAFMGWDLNYAMEWCRAIEPARALDRGSLPCGQARELPRNWRETTIPVATGEHFYGRWEVRRYLEAEAISVVQADPEWCGGVSELVKICAIASAYDAHVVPHGHNVHAALHVVASQSPMTCPLVELLILKMGSYYFFDKHPPVAVDGQLELSDRPGFGMELDEAKIDKRTRLSWA